MRALEIAWTEPAVADVSETLAWIAGRNPEAARRWQARIVEAVEHAASFPLAGRRVPELDRDDVREVLVGKYRVVYRVTASHVIVWAVREGHRLLDDDVVADAPG